VAAALVLLCGAGLEEAARRELGPFSPAEVVLPSGARLAYAPCPFDPGFLARASCARLTPSDGEGHVAVVILHASPLARRRSPIVYLTGGPGQAVGLDADALDDWRSWREALGWNGDLVLLDPRGTGESTPRLDCPELQRVVRQELPHAREPHETFPAEAVALAACRDRLTGLGIDLRRYTTKRSGDDVAELLDALGGDEWNVYGVSYGTRLALRVLADHPERLRTVILDSTYPPQQDSFTTWPAVLDGAFDTLLRGCAADDRCHAAFPDLDAELTALLARARAEPIHFRVPDPDGGAALDVAVDDHRLVAVLFDALYRWERIAEIPARIAHAKDDPVAALQPLVEDFVASLFDPDASDGSFYAVECQDEPPRPPRAAYLALAAARPRVTRYVRDDWDVDPCRVFDLPAAPPSETAPVSSSLPVLLLAGQYDPVTPVAWAKAAAETLPHAKLVVVPGMAHGVLDGDTCAAEIALRFLEEPDRRPVAGCEGELAGAEFDTRFEDVKAKDDAPR
jgi:pimeloyl-ACP methyl ester carboxylesterase